MQTEVADSEVAIQAALAGSLIVERAFGRDVSRVPKVGDDFATEVDIRAEEAIRDVLCEHRPRDGVVGEELGSHDGDSGRTWLVDPLCGTRNFAFMAGAFSVNVALREGDKVRVAAVAEPLARRVLWTDGSQVYERRDGRSTPVRPSAESRIVEVNADSAGDDIGPRLVSDVHVRSWMSPRVSASTLVLGWVAAGQRAAYASDGDLRHSVHFAAGIALCRAAGCLVGDLSGGDVNTGDGLLIAADQETWHQLSTHVGRHRVPS